MSERLYVAIDGGNSKTHVAVGSTDGRLHGFVRGPGSSPHMIGVPGTVALLDSLVRQAVARANLPVGTVLSRAEVYIAGADLPVEVHVLMKAVRQAGPASTGWTTTCSHCRAPVPRIPTRWRWCAVPGSTASVAPPTVAPLGFQPSVT